MSKRMQAVGGIIVAVGLVLTAGCKAGKLNLERDFVVGDAESAKEYTLPAQSAAQTVQIEVTADKPVDVFVIPAKDAPDLGSATTKDWQQKATTHKLGVTNDKLSAKVPANQETKVVIAPSAKTAKAQGKVKMTN